MSQESCLEKLEQLVNDENRIVTYKILSREMKIHVNKAKEYLNLFFANPKSDENVSLVAHYFLAGFYAKDGGESVKVLIVPESKLEESKQEFKELTSCHIYSVSKVRLKDDECALYATDIPYNRDTEEQKKYAAIKHPNIQIQNPVLNTVDALKNETKSADQKNQNVVLSNGNSTAVLSKQNIKNGSIEKTFDSSKKETKPSNEKLYGSKESKNSPDKNGKQNTLASLWQKKEETNTAKKEVPKADTKGKKAPKTIGKNNIRNMFSKQAEKNAISGKKVDSNSFPKQETVAPKIEPKQEDSSSTSPSKSDTKPSKVSQKRKSSKKQSSKKFKEQTESNLEEEFQPKKKKHRRICTFEDSDSDSENEEVQDKAQRNLLNSHDEIASTPAVASDDSEEPIPPTPPIHNAVKIKGKVWKTVQKTYQDDDGFFVTKKEKELVSASDDSDEDPLKSKKKEASPKKTPIKSISTNKKQASLTNYFRQK